MAKGVKKPIQQKITEKEELIAAITRRLESERRELKELIEKKDAEELLRIKEFVNKTGLSPEELANILISNNLCQKTEAE